MWEEGREAAPWEEGVSLQPLTMRQVRRGLGLGC